MMKLIYEEVYDGIKYVYMKLIIHAKCEFAIDVAEWYCPVGEGILSCCCLVVC